MSATRIFFFPLDTVTEMPDTWRLVNPMTHERRELVNHPAWLPLYLKLLSMGWQDVNETSVELAETNSVLDTEASSADDVRSTE
jgi:hypothetical protein